MINEDIIKNYTIIEEDGYDLKSDEDFFSTIYDKRYHRFEVRVVSNVKRVIGKEPVRRKIALHSSIY